MTQFQPPLRRASRAARSLTLSRGRTVGTDRPTGLSKTPKAQPKKRFVDARRSSSVKTSLRPRLASPRVRSERRLAELCRSLGCDSAVFLALDEPTATLLVKVQAGLPRLVTIRPLAEATADLEALCGHAVVLENDRAIRQWQPPAECRAAVCVPVATADCPLGTLWLFGDAPRSFSDSEVNEIELAAGQLAMLWAQECPVAVAAVGSSGSTAASVAAAPRTDMERVGSKNVRQPRPSDAPHTLLATARYGEFEIASWSQGEGLGPIGEWIDLGTGRLALAIGESACGDRALATACLRGAIRVHAHEAPQAGKLLERLNGTLADLFSGEGLAAHLFLATLDLGTGLVGYALAGEMLALRMRPSGWQSLRQPSIPLGFDPLASYTQYRLALEPGETLALVTPGDLMSAWAGKKPARGAEEELARWLSLVGWQSASDLAVGTALQLPRARAGHSDRAVLIVKRN